MQVKETTKAMKSMKAMKTPSAMKNAQRQAKKGNTKSMKAMKAMKYMKAMKSKKNEAEHNVMLCLSCHWCQKFRFDRASGSYQFKNTYCQHCGQSFFAVVE